MKPGYELWTSSKLASWRDGSSSEGSYNNGWALNELDIKTAVFSMEDVKEDFYLEIPEGIAGAEDRKTKARKLNRSVNGHNV